MALNVLTTASEKLVNVTDVVVVCIKTRPSVAFAFVWVGSARGLGQSPIAS